MVGTSAEELPIPLNTHWKKEVGYDTATIKPPEKPDFGLRMFHFFTLHNSYQEPYKVMAELDVRLFNLPAEMFFLL